ncbi:MAG: addiction module protein [bacterium]
MDSKTLLEEALNLRPAERLQLIQWIAESLDRPDDKITQIWAEESEKRYRALKEGKVRTIPLDAVIRRYR